MPTSCFKISVKMQERFLTWIQSYDLQFKKEHGSEVRCCILPYKLQRPHFILSHSSVTTVLSKAEKECNIDLNNLDWIVLMSSDCWSNRGSAARYHHCVQIALLNKDIGEAKLHAWSGPYAHLIKCSIKTKSRFFMLLKFFLHDYTKTKSHKHLDSVKFIF